MNLVYQELQEIQKKLVAKKSEYNQFGKYPYRTAEGILAEIKPLLKNCVVLVNEEIKQIGDRYYVLATATLTDGETGITCASQAREDLELKGMTGGQLSGTTSSYAKKYALANLFAIDGVEKDLDAIENSDTKENKPKESNNTQKEEKPQEKPIFKSQAEINIMQIHNLCQETKGFFEYNDVVSKIKSKMNLNVEDLTPNQLRALLSALNSQYQKYLMDHNEKNI